jgi:hypothetical protein
VHQSQDLAHSARDTPDGWPWNAYCYDFDVRTSTRDFETRRFHEWGEAMSGNEKGVQNENQPLTGNIGGSPTQVPAIFQGIRRKTAHNALCGRV